MANFRKKTHFTLVIALALLILLLLSFWLFTSNQKDVAIGVCSSREEGGVLEQAEVAFASTGADRTSKLEKLEANIIQKDDYEEDPNCVFPLIVSSLERKNIVRAEDYFMRFETVYGDGATFVSDIYPVNNIDDVRQLLEFSKSYQDKVSRPGGNITEPVVREE